MAQVQKVMNLHVHVSAVLFSENQIFHCLLNNDSNNNVNNMVSGRGKVWVTYIQCIYTFYMGSLIIRVEGCS